VIFSVSSMGFPAHARRGGAAYTSSVIRVFSIHFP
jgi:hypothetical protein